MNTTETTTHCQICSREIKAKTGLIAHHGYQRPQGWYQQTASCEGARQLPYEVSRDYIPVVIKRYETFAKNQIELADEMFNNPPKTITRFARSSYDTDTVYDKPEDFDPSKDSYSFYDSYAYEFKRIYREHRKSAESIKSTIKFLQKRYDGWKPQS